MCSSDLFRLRFKSTQRMIKFATVGSIGIFVNLIMSTSMRNILYGIFGKGNDTLLGASLDRKSVV